MISSSTNAQIKYLVKLQEKGSVRHEDKVFVCEGKKMFLEVLNYARKSIIKAYFSESFFKLWQKEAEPKELLDISYEIVSDSVLKEVSKTVTPQGVLAIVRQPEYTLDNMIKGTSKKDVKSEKKVRLLLLENLRDPGNLGTILRTAEGAGITGVILSRESVDVFNPKVIRSTMGAIYRVPFFYAPDFYDLLCTLNEQEIKIFAAHLAGSVEYDAVKYPDRTAIMIGNEANGLTSKACELAAGKIRIPMEGSVESLNAAVAAALLMYEVYRQGKR